VPASAAVADAATAVDGARMADLAKLGAALANLSAHGGRAGGGARGGAAGPKRRSRR